MFATVESTGSEENLRLLCDTVMERPLNPDKIQAPSEIMDIMGVSVDVRNRTIAIPEGKMADISETVNQFAKKTFMSKRELQSLLGKLLYISKIIRPARGFLNRMLQTLWNMQGCNKVKINDNFRRDLNWC